MQGKQGRSIGGNELYWQLRNSVESTRQLQLRNELIAKRTLSAAVGAGHFGGPSTVRSPAIRADLAGVPRATPAIVSTFARTDGEFVEIVIPQIHLS